MNYTFLPQSGKAGLIIVATLLLTLTGCDPYYGMPGLGHAGSNPYYAPVYGSRSNYTYFPRYSTYYHHPTQQYHYHNGSSWVTSPRPDGVVPGVLQASPAVPLYLPSHPQQHHQQIMRNYPRTWAPSMGRHEERHEWGHSGWDLDRR